MNNSVNFICFVHIEKCGGTTLHNILLKNYKGYLALSSSKGVNLPFSGDYLRKLRQLLSPYKVMGIGGHTVFPYFEYSKSIDPKEQLYLFTMLRNPIDRYMSHINHQINTMGINWSLEEFMKEEEFKNFQVKKIAGCEDLDKAKDIIINKMSFVGFIEHFDEGLLIIKQNIGEPLKNAFYQKANVLEEKIIKRKYNFKSLDSTLQEKIIANNNLDLELYDYVKQHIYPKYVNAYSGNLNEDLNDFKLKNKTYKNSFFDNQTFKVKNFLTRKFFQKATIWLSPK